MGFDFKAEVEHAYFLDFVDNNLQKIKDFLLLEHEDILRELYENPEWIE